MWQLPFVATSCFDFVHSDTHHLTQSDSVIRLNFPTKRRERLSFRTLHFLQLRSLVCHLIASILNRKSDIGHSFGCIDLRSSDSLIADHFQNVTNTMLHFLTFETRQLRLHWYQQCEPRKRTSSEHFRLKLSHSVLAGENNSSWEYLSTGVLSAFWLRAPPSTGLTFIDCNPVKWLHLCGSSEPTGPGVSVDV